MRSLVVALVACGSPAGPISPAACAEQCVRMAGSDSAFCASVCDSTCAQRCAALLSRVGDGIPCDEVCTHTCVELKQTYGFDDDVCGWLVEDRPNATYTPRSLTP